jgi:hypothetical protein
MAIDRIGKGGPAGGASLPREVGPTDKAERPFEATRPSPVQKLDAAAPAGPLGPLDRLRSGEIDVHKYLDIKVDEATAHLHGLPPAEMDTITKMLRDQLATDPGLADLVKQATGAAPPPVDD